jgi:hypothetical protein
MEPWRVQAPVLQAPWAQTLLPKQSMREYCKFNRRKPLEAPWKIAGTVRL